MSRPLRIEFSGAVYHITSRGDGREDIFLSDDDREVFLGVLENVVERFGWLCHAYCLMPNHYHLMIETPTANLSAGMRQLNGVYTQRFNRSHDQVGHVFQGRFKAILVEKDAHLLSLCSYIVRNPVAADMVDDVTAWHWSSYRATVGLAAIPAFLTVSWVLDQFGGDVGKYRRFVADQGILGSPLKKSVMSNVLGSDQFRDQVQQHIHGDTEVPRAQRFVRQKSLPELESATPDRRQWMAEAYRNHGYTMREIADYAQLHYSSVSKLIRSWEIK